VCAKKGICEKDEIYSLVANAIPDQAEEHAATIYEEFLRRQEIMIHEKTLQRLNTGDSVTQTIQDAEAERETVHQFSDDKDKSRVDRCNSFYDELSKARRGEKPRGASTGLPNVDRYIGGIGIGGRFSIWAGRPGMGKSTFAWTAAMALADQSVPVCFIPLEMTTDEMLSKYVQAQTKISRGDMIEGRLTDNDMIQIHSALARFHDLPIYIEENATLWGQIKNKIRQYKRKYGVRVFFIDYLQLIEERSQRHQNKTLEVEAITRGMVLTAKREGVDIVCLSQLSRECEKRGNKRPIMSDLRHSGGIEQDAGQVLFFYRDEYYGIMEDHEGRSTKGVTEVIVAKNRYLSSSTGTALVGYNIPRDCFAPLDEEEEATRIQPDYNPHIEPERKNTDDDIPF